MAGLPRHRPRGPNRNPDAVEQVLAVTWPSCPPSRRVQPMSQSTPTTPRSAPNWCSAKREWPALSPNPAYNVGRGRRTAGAQRSDSGR